MKAQSLFILTALVTLSGASAEAKLRKWNQKMQELGKTFSELLPDLADSKPVTPATQKKLERGAKKLLELAHTVNAGPDSKGGSPLPPEADPTLGFISHMFEREVKLANNALHAGKTGYAKAVLRTVSGYCIACHSRHDKGPDFPGMTLSQKTEGLSDLDKAELLAATRQFDASLDLLEKLVGNAAFAKKNQVQWGRAVRHAFTLSIRVKRDPDRTLAMMGKITSLPSYPGFYSSNIPAWKKSLEDWKAEPKTEINGEEGLFAAAMKLTKAAQDLQKYPRDRSADVLYLRSTALIHDLLTQYPNGKRTSEALMMAGSAYELLEDGLTYTLPDYYYEACIRNSPHSPISEKCFQRYEDNVIFGYSGSAGSFVPDDVQGLLSELRGLSQVKVTEKSGQISP